MASNKIRVNTESLNSTCTRLQARLGKVKKDIENISGDMDKLNSMWEGDAHTAFSQSVSQDISDLLSACDGVQGIINYEDNAVTEYNKCENQVADLISQIQI